MNQQPLPEARNTAVREFLDANAARAGHTKQPFFVTFQAKYRTTKHPVLGAVDVTAAVGLKADHHQDAVEWARHWLGTRGFAAVLGYEAFVEAGDRFPGGCPTMSAVPSSRHFVSVKGERLVVWEDGSTDFYDADGKRRAVPASVPANVSASDLASSESWVEVWFSFDGERLSSEQVFEVCVRAGVGS